MLAEDAGDVAVPEGPLVCAIDGSCLLPGALGVDRARQALLAAAVREEVALVVFSWLAPERAATPSRSRRWSPPRCARASAPRSAADDWSQRYPATRQRRRPSDGGRAPRPRGEPLRATR